MNLIITHSSRKDNQNKMLLQLSRKTLQFRGISATQFRVRKLTSSNNTVKGEPCKNYGKSQTEGKNYGKSQTEGKNSNEKKPTTGDQFGTAVALFGWLSLFGGGSYQYRG